MQLMHVVWCGPSPLQDIVSGCCFLQNATLMSDLNDGRSFFMTLSNCSYFSHQPCSRTTMFSECRGYCVHGIAGNVDSRLCSNSTSEMNCSIFVHVLNDW